MASITEKAGAPPDDVSLTSIPAAESHKFKELAVYKSGLSNFKICPAGSETAKIFVDTALYTPSKADITLHEGADSHGRVLGVANLKRFAGHYEVAIGDPSSNKEDVVWEPLEVVQYWASRHSFESEFGKEGVKNFIWRHPGEKLSDHPGDMELVEEMNPDFVLAQYVKTGTHSWKTRGNLLIREGYGDVWDLMVTLTGMALVVVKSRR